MAEPFAAVRDAEFPWMNSAAPYFNAASFTPLPLRSRRAVDAFNATKYEAHRISESAFGTVLAGAREALARLIGAGADDVALTTNTSTGLNLAAGFAALAGGAPIDGDRRRRRILVSEGEFPANVYPWLGLERMGFTVELVSTDELGRPREERLLERLEQASDVAIFALSHVQFGTGYRADLSRFGRVCRDLGILFVVDAIQGLGAVPLDVIESQVDVLACGGHKWLCGPWGTGFVYVRRELCTRLEPLNPGWLSFVPSQDFANLLDYRFELVEDARRFEVGVLPFQDFAGLAASAELLEELGGEWVWRHIRGVQEPLITWAREREDVEIVSDLREERRSGVICIRPTRVDDAWAALRRAGVACAVRGGAIRLAPHFYNTVGEMERVVDVLDEALRT